MGFIGDLFNSNKGSGFQGGGSGDPNAMQNAADQNRYAYAQQKQFVDSLQNANANTPYEQVNLANVLKAQMSGQGPNPALSQLATATGQNTQNQAALMAGQRGIGANPGLLSRNIAMQGASNQQQAAGQAATLRAQQQLAAQGQLQSQYANMLQEQQQGVAGLGQLALGNQGQQFNLQGNVNDVNSKIAQGNQAGQQQIVGGLMSGAGMAGAPKTVAAAHGGQIPVQHLAYGGPALGVTSQPLMPNVLPVAQQAPNRLNLGVNYQMPGGPAIPQAQSGPGFDVNMGFTPDANPYGDIALPGGPQSNLAKASMDNPNTPIYNGTRDLVAGLGKASAGLGKASKNFFYPGDDAATVPITQEGEKTGDRVLKSNGGKIKGQPKVSGDSEQNDTVPAMLSPGEVVIPRSKVNDPEKVSKFLNALLGMNLKA